MEVMHGELAFAAEAELLPRLTGRRCENCDTKLHSYEPERIHCDRCFPEITYRETTVFEDWDGTSKALEMAARNNILRANLYEGFVQRSLLAFRSDYHEGYAGGREGFCYRLAEIVPFEDKNFIRRKFRKAWDRLLRKGHIVTEMGANGEMVARGANLFGYGSEADPIVRRMEKLRAHLAYGKAHPDHLYEMFVMDALELLGGSMTRTEDRAWFPTQDFSAEETCEIRKAIGRLTRQLKVAVKQENGDVVCRLRNVSPWVMQGKVQRTRVIISEKLRALIPAPLLFDEDHFRLGIATAATVVWTALMWLPALCLMAIHWGFHDQMLDAWGHDPVRHVAEYHLVHRDLDGDGIIGRLNRDNHPLPPLEPKESSTFTRPAPPPSSDWYFQEPSKRQGLPSQI